jgi:hypothetical protein
LTYLRKKFLARKRTLAGRSARRRMKYGYHSSPKGGDYEHIGRDLGSAYFEPGGTTPFMRRYSTICP